MNVRDAKTGIRVELALHAGEEDPYWIIRKPDHIALIQRGLQDLPTVSEPGWPTLGWRGFRLVGLTDGTLPGRVRIFEGTICIENGLKDSCYRDQHKLGDWLQSEARRQGLGRFIPSSWH
jgi:hypothetical protein